MIKSKFFNTYLIITFTFFLVACETTKSDPYTLLNLNHPSDIALKNKLENELDSIGKLLNVYVDSEELRQYRSGQKISISNFIYQIAVKPDISLETIKAANIKFKDNLSK